MLVPTYRGKFDGFKDADTNVSPALSRRDMAYWLSNLSALLFLLQQSLKSGGAADATPVKKPPNPTSLFGRMTMVLNIPYILCNLISLSHLKSCPNLFDGLISGFPFIPFFCQPSYPIIGYCTQGRS